MTPDSELLKRYVEHGSDPSFAELVERYLPLVYSAALRQASGDSGVAQDAAQAVFTDLARKAVSLQARASIAGWLYTSTHFAVAKLVRSEQRRRDREKEAQTMTDLLQGPAPEYEWQQLRAVLDDSMRRLKEKEREAILLRYFENQAFSNIAARLGTTENAARMRVERALDKLRVILSSRGMAPGAGLAQILGSYAVEAAPPGMAATIATTAVTSAAQTAASSTTIIFWRIMTAAKTKTTVAALATLACLLVPFILQHQVQARLESQDDVLKRQSGTLALITGENQRMAAVAAASALSDAQSNELLRLRDEARQLAPRTNAVAALRMENQRLKASAARSPSATDPFQVKEEIIATELHVRDWMMAFHEFANRNQDRFPTSFEEALSVAPGGTQTNLAGRAGEFEIVYQGARKALAKPEDVIVIRQKEPRPPAPSAGRKGSWARIYGFADGSVRLHQEAENDFENYERQHTAP